MTFIFIINYFSKMFKTNNKTFNPNEFGDAMKFFLMLLLTGMFDMICIIMAFVYTIKEIFV